MTLDFSDILATNGSQHVCGIVQNYSTACNKVHDLYPIETTMNIPAWAALILAACLVCGEGKITPNNNFNRNIHHKATNIDNDINHNTITASNHADDGSEKKKKEHTREERFEETLGLKVGRTINVFPRYGSLTLSLKVLPSRFSDNWLFREKSSEIFESSSYWAKFGGTSQNGGFDAHFLIDFCDTSNDLLAAYFDHFKIEGIPETHKAFTSFLSTKSKAQALGIYSTFLESADFSFVLIRLFRRETRALLDGDLRLNPAFINASQRIRVGSSESAHQFMDNFGSHVIVEYELGDVIYQVFVFGQGIYNELKTTFALSYEEVKRNFTAYNQSPNELLNIKSYFTPYFAMHVGQVKMASGSSEFDRFRNKLKKRYFRFRFYQSIFETLNEKEIAEELANIKGEVITGMRLKKITKALTPTPERYWLSVILDNALSLYYITM